VGARALAMGYWRDASLTAARFSQGAPGSGIRIFRSGDLGRFNADGVLEYVGRKDAQVKVRGFRVILTDVEDAIRRLPAVQSAAVCALGQPDHDVQIAAYVVLDRDAPPSANALKRALHARLSDHMVPSAFVVLDRLPLTASGKVDYHALRQMKPSNSAGSAEPRLGATEQALAAIWAEALDLPSVSRDDDFFSLGGDSLRAVVIQARIQHAFGVQPDLGIFADDPTLASMATVIDKARAVAAAVAVPPIARVSRSEPLPLSSFQERIWSYSQTPDGSAGYCSTNVYRILGALDSALLAACLSDVTNRHEVLRTTYSVVRDRPMQIIHPPAHVPMTFVDLSSAQDAKKRATLMLDEWPTEIFDLEKGPLVRFSLVRIHDREHWLLRSAHHIAYDAWSWKMFMRELAELYAARLRGETPSCAECKRLQYADYAVWQRSMWRRQSIGYQQTVSWWKDVLCNPPRPLQLPFRRASRLGGLNPSQGIIELRLDPRASRRLAELARTKGATHYIVRLAALVPLLAAVTKQSDVLIGIYATNRNHPDLQGLFGFFVSLVALRFRFEPSKSFCEWFLIVRSKVWLAAARCEISYEDLRSALQQQGVTPPDIELIFGKDGDIDGDDPSIESADLVIKWLTKRQRRMPWGFSIEVNEDSDRCTARFDAGLYDPVGIRHFVARYIRLLEAASQHPQLPIAKLLEMTGSDLKSGQ
jgi:hypothetical protein